MNHFAAMYLDYAKRFEAPLDQYAADCQVRGIRGAACVFISRL